MTLFSKELLSCPDAKDKDAIIKNTAKKIHKKLLFYFCHYITFHFKYKNSKNVWAFCQFLKVVRFQYFALLRSKDSPAKI